MPPLSSDFQSPACTVSHRTEEDSSHETSHRDLLNRHKLLSHNSTQTRTVSPPSGEQASTDARQIRADGQVIAGGNSSSSALAEQETFHDPSRLQLEESYFRSFHLYWPLLHRKTYQSTRQPAELVEAVLTAGLWVTGTAEAEAQAKSRHSKLLRQTADYLTKLETDESATDLRQADLSGLQAILILLILTTYRGPDALLPAIGKTQRLFRVCQRYGIYDQPAIDAASPEIVVREQYQRLALLHFKFLVHLNANMAKYMPQASPLTYLTPQVLNVGIPLAASAWEKEARHVKAAKNSHATVSRLLPTNDEALKREAMALLVSWDFTLGMILGCYWTRKTDDGEDGEDDRALAKRIEPLLYSHLQFRQAR
ncbi:hypothetical protein N3K66_006106 [Trichothecium roseum]|uniref:Uncharacterized protein n=1 Tax=Trichothecium roseum TaxID=47278 RepID=A0ACC0V2F9_9HYPO|nr:hypothetical protein N3K66_006106 [Trichothecium roseum]